MASLRPAKCYRKIERPNTRQSRKKPKKGYVKGVPGKKINKFWVGNQHADFPVKVHLKAKSAVQIRHNALEAARVTLNKYLEKQIGKENYFMRILVYPHHVMRENALATGAGADRFQTGMRKAFGKPIGVAAQVRPEQNLIEVRTIKGKEKDIREGMRRASMKFPTPCFVEFSN